MKTLDRRAMLELIGWKLCVYDPAIAPSVLLLHSDHQFRKRYFVCPVRPSWYCATLRDTEDEALADLPVRIIPSP